MTESSLTYKVRLYPREDWAAEQEALLELVSDDIQIPGFVGRVDRYLIFEHTEVDQVQVKDLDAARNIGRFLGSIAMHATNTPSVQELDGEFSRWLEVLVMVGFFPAGMTTSIENQYQKMRPRELRICLDYWDAMPHNFGWHNEDFYLLDEKHLRYSFEGVGLVKPSILLEEGEFQEVLDGYLMSSSVDNFQAHLSFLAFYYWVAALYFYALRKKDGVRHLPANPRLRSYRLGLMRESGLSFPRRLIEEVRFSMYHPLDSLIFYINHMLEPLSWLNIIRRATTAIVRPEEYET